MTKIDQEGLKIISRQSFFLNDPKNEKNSHNFEVLKRRCRRFLKLDSKTNQNFLLSTSPHEIVDPISVFKVRLLLHIALMTLNRSLMMPANTEISLQKASFS